jgi:hypothetical protein
MIAWVRRRPQAMKRAAAKFGALAPTRVPAVASAVVRRNTMLLWTLVAFFAGTLLFGSLRRATEDSSTAVTVLVQLGALAVVIGVIVLVMRRLR